MTKGFLKLFCYFSKVLFGHKHERSPTVDDSLFGDIRVNTFSINLEIFDSNLPPILTSQLVPVNPITLVSWAIFN